MENTKINPDTMYSIKDVWREGYVDQVFTTYSSVLNYAKSHISEMGMQVFDRPRNKDKKLYFIKGSKLIAWLKDRDLLNDND